MIQVEPTIQIIKSEASPPKENYPIRITSSKNCQNCRSQSREKSRSSKQLRIHHHYDNGESISKAGSSENKFRLKKLANQTSQSRSRSITSSIKKSPLEDHEKEESLKSNPKRKLNRASMPVVEIDDYHIANKYSSMNMTNTMDESPLKTQTEPSTKLKSSDKVHKRPNNFHIRKMSDSSKKDDSISSAPVDPLRGSPIYPEQSTSNQDITVKEKSQDFPPPADKPDSKHAHPADSQ